MGKTKVIEAKKDKMPFWFIPAWSTRSISAGVSVVVMMQLTFYSTDVLGLPTALVGTIFLVSKIVDGFTDLFAGFIIDRTRTKMGKGRPYELFLIPTWLLIVAVYSTPDMGTVGKVIFLFVLYTLINAVCMTFLQASETVYMGRAVPSERNRGVLMALSGVIVMLVSAVGSMTLPQLMNTWGREPGGWTKIALVYAVPMLVIGLIRFFTIREKPIDSAVEESNKITFRQSLRVLSKNKYIFILAALIMLSSLVTNITSISGTYYFSYVIGDLGLMSIIGMVGLLGPFVLLLFPVAMKTIGGVGFVRIGLIAAALASILRFAMPNNLAVVVITVALSGIGVNSIMMMNHFFILQAVDYGELTTGVRVEGTPSSLCNFANKVGGALGSMIIGGVMALGGYVSTAAQQPDSAVFAIRSIYSLIPAILCVVMLVVLHFYNVEKKLPDLRKIREESQTASSS